MASTRFSSEIKDLAEVPDPLRRALQDRLPGIGDPLLIAYGPSYTSMGRRSPGTVIAITKDGWLGAADTDDGSAAAEVESTFGDTLLLELTEILLYGHLKIDFTANGEARYFAVEFNTVMHKLYRRVMDLLLTGIEGPHDQPGESRADIESAVYNWPGHLRHGAIDNVPAWHRPLAAVLWPAVTGGFRRELAPAAGLVVTDRQVLLVSEERSGAWDRICRMPKYGSVVTCFPLARLADYQLHADQRVGVLDLQMTAPHGGESLHVLFPPTRQSAIREAMEQIEINR